jgi:hypothetical protein
MDMQSFGARASNTPENVPQSGVQSVEKLTTEHPNFPQDVDNDSLLTMPDVVPDGLTSEVSPQKQKNRGLVKTLGAVGAGVGLTLAGFGIVGGLNKDSPDQAPTATADTPNEPVEPVDAFHPSEEVEIFMDAYATKYNLSPVGSVDEQNQQPAFSDDVEKWAASVFNAEQAYIRSHNGAGIIIGDEVTYREEYPSSEVLQIGEMSPLGFTAAKWENGKEPTTENFVDFVNNQTLPNYESLANALIKNPSAADQIRQEFINYPGLGKEGSDVIVDTMATIASNHGPDTNITFNKVSPDSTTPIEENSHLVGGVGLDATDEDGNPTKVSAPVELSYIATTYDEDGDTTSVVYEVSMDTGVDLDPGFNPFENAEQLTVGLYAQQTP